MTKPIIFLEEIEIAVRNFLNTNLNPAIIQLNTDIGDGLDILEIQDRAYLFQVWSDKILNEKVFLYYGITRAVGESIPTATSEIYTVEVSVVISEANRETLENFKKLFRYQHVLKEIFKANTFKILNRGEKLTITDLEPISIQLGENNNFYKAIGIEFELSYWN